MGRNLVGNQDWFARSFDEHYARIYRYKDETALAEVARLLRYLRLRRRRPGPQRILDLACGWGRHSVPLAQKGFAVTGVDFSEVMLRLASERATEAGLKTLWLNEDDTEPPPPNEAGSMSLLQVDMRDLPFDDQFDVVLDIFTSFGYFRDPADNDAVIASVFRALVPGGKFLLDIDNPQVFIDQNTGQNVFKIPRNGSEERVLRVEKYERERDLRVVEYSFIDRPGDKRDEIYLECKLYGRAELTSLLATHGFHVEDKVWGDFDGHAFNAETSPRLITVATKPRR